MVSIDTAFSLKAESSSRLRILFPLLSARQVTGARYAESVILRALRRKYLVETVCFEGSLLCGLPLPREFSYMLFALYPYLVKDSYDLVFTSDSYVFADLVYVQPPAGRNVCLPVRDSVFLGEGLGPALKLLELPLDRMVKANASFVANSKYTQELIRRFLGKPSRLLYPPVPIHLYHSLPNNHRENLVVTIASLNPRKNLEVLPELCRRIPEARFILIGHYYPRYSYLLRELHSRLKRQGVGDRFTYLPSASERTKRMVLGRAKALFHPTINEPFGISIAEGMAAGLIPVAHNSGGPREFVPQEWRYETVEEAVEKVEKALHGWNPKLAEEMRLKVYYFREERFEEEVLKIVEEFLSERVEALSRY